MQHRFFPHAVKSLLFPALLLGLAGCDEASAPAADAAPEATVVEAPASPVDMPAPAAPQADVSPAAEPGVTAAPKAAPAPQPAARPKPSAAPAPAEKAPAETAPADPHAGHDMSEMSDDEMKAMGH